MAKRELKKNTNIAEEPIEVVKNDEIKTGIVTDCSRLNIRKSSKIDSEVLEIVDVGTELNIDTSKSTNDWFKVRTKSGKRGFCMKKYVTIKENSNGEHTDID